MAKVIGYTNDNGLATVIVPFLECGLTLQQIADKDVPKGKPYKFIESSDLPTDYTFYEAWEIDLSAPDGTGADHGAGSMNAVTGWNEDGTPQTRKEAVCQ